MIYIVTGTPGTGKTYFAKDFANKNNCTYIDGKEIIKEYSLVDSFDSVRNVEVIDEEKFANICKDIILLAKKNNESIIIDSHISHFIDSNLIDTCFITKCNLKVLNQRLFERGYSKSKIRENLDAEIFMECQLEAEEFGHNIQIIETS